MTQRKPEALRLLAGTARKDRNYGDISTLLPKIDETPAPPDWLTDATALLEWHRLAPKLTSCGVLRETMVSSLAHLCQLHAVLVRSYASPEPPSAALLSAYTRLAGLFGLTAVDVRRLPVPEPRPRQNKWSDLRETP